MLATCARHDLLGNWELVDVRFTLSIQKSRRPPICSPTNSFNTTTQGGVKSAHSLRPILENPDRIFETVPLEMTYQVEPERPVASQSQGSAPAC